MMQQIGRYQILREIGRGGMGHVFEAYDAMLHRKVALKILLNQEEFSREKEYFLREAQNTAKLRHPNIVTVYAIEEEKGQIFFTMDLIEGSTFSNLLEKKEVSIIQSIETLEKIARAVHYAHKQGIIHRDIKPSNIMLTKENEPKLMDFGLAKEIKGNKISQSGIIVGTPAYMAPEQMEGNGEYRSDVYSLGAVLYEIITGKPPFESETSIKLMLRAMEKEPFPPRKINPSIGKELEAICLKALAKKPVFRYQNAQEFADDLHRYLTGKSTLARPMTALDKVKKWAKNNMLLLFGSCSLFVSFLILIYIALFFWILDVPAHQSWRRSGASE